MLKLSQVAAMVLSIPTGNYNEALDFPQVNDLIGLSRILVTVPKIISHKFEGALFPIELANGIASMSSYPSAKKSFNGLPIGEIIYFSDIYTLERNHYIS